MKKYRIVIVTFIFLFQGCFNKNPVPITDKQWELLSYFPNNTSILIYFNFDELRKSNFWEDYFKNSLKDQSTEKWLKEFKDKTGIGLESGLAQFYLATTWEGKNSFVIIFNRNKNKVKDFFESSIFNKDTVGNKIIYSKKDNQFSNFYFPDDSTLLVINNKSYLKKVIKQQNKSLSRNKNFVDVVQNIKTKNYYWMATDRADLAISLIKNLVGNSKNTPAKKLLNSINSFSISASFKNNITLESNLGCDNSENSYLLATAIRGALAMDLLSRKNKILAEILNKANVNRVDKNVYLEVNLNDEDLNELQEFAKQQNIEKKL